MVNKMVNIRISVRALVEHLLRRGDLSMSFDIATRSSLFAGSHAHQKIQKSRPEPYSTEIPVYYRVDNERIALDIQLTVVDKGIVGAENHYAHNKENAPP